MPTLPAESIYLDNAASMAMRPEAVSAMVPLLSQAGNPSSLHAAGRAARRHLEEARESIAADLGARPSEIVFTSGGTEADNLALAGIAAARRAIDPGRRRIVISAVEHHFNGFIQDTIKIGEKFIVLGSIRGDRVPYLQKVIPSPRGSIIYKRTKDDAFRFTASFTVPRARFDERLSLPALNRAAALS